MAQKSALGQAAFQKFAELRLGFWCRGALHATAELRVADVLSDGPKISDGIARATDRAESLHRLLRMLAGHEVFEGDDSCRFHL
jgi:hypothetical protein